MDAVDKHILDILQHDFPLLSTPFRAIGKEAGVPEQEVITRIAALKKDGIIRQISPIFDSSQIGYHSTLAALKVPPGSIEKIAQKLNEHSGISHNYLRDGVYNIWFTLTMPRSVNLESEVTRIASACSIRESLFLPALKTFKIGFTLNMTGSSRRRRLKPVLQSLNQYEPVHLNPEFIRIVQQDMPLISHPFAEAAELLGVSEDAIIAMLEAYISKGWIRRIAAVLKPVQAGFPVNLLVAWSTKSQDVIDSLGMCAASFPTVSHCYQRPFSSVWPYSVYTMLHGQTIEECDAVVAELAESTSGVDRYCKLVTLRELKKERVMYYPKH